MALRHHPVYQPTTISDSSTKDFTTSGYLANSLDGRCTGKTRLKLVLSTATVFCFSLGVIMIGIGISNISQSSGEESKGNDVALCTLGGLLLGMCSFFLLLYLRQRGTCNLPCWPLRSTLISRQLNESRSATQVTIVDEDNVAINESRNIASQPEESSRLINDEEGPADMQLKQDDPRIVLKPLQNEDENC